MPPSPSAKVPFRNLWKGTFATDFLRQLANAIEEDSAGETFETARGCAVTTTNQKQNQQ